MSVAGGGPGSERGVPRKATGSRKPGPPKASFYAFNRESERWIRGLGSFVGGVEDAPQKEQ